MEGPEEVHNAVDEEGRQAPDLAEESYVGVELAAAVEAAAGYSDSDSGARRTHGDAGQFYSVQNIVCRSSKQLALDVS